MEKKSLRPILGVLPVLAVLVLPVAGYAADARDSGGIGAGFELRPQASAADIGLPIYPGATRRIDKDDDSNGLTMSAWGGVWGFKLTVVKLASSAPIDQVENFYRDELSRYGEILDCSQSHAMAKRRVDDQRLDCDDGKADGEAHVYKVGVAKHQRVVSLRKKGQSVEIDLVRIEASD